MSSGAKVIEAWKETGDEQEGKRNAAGLVERDAWNRTGDGQPKLLRCVWRVLSIRTQGQMHLGVRSSQNEKEVNKTPAEKSDRGIFLSVKVVSANVRERPQLRLTKVSV